MIGKTLNGKYQLIEMIRDQRFYVSYAARLVNTETRNLVKTFKIDPAQAPALFERLKPNLAVVSSLRHSGIAYLRDFGMDQEVYVVEEYYEGTPLSQVLKSGAALNTAQALDLGIKISEALAHAHGKGVVHGMLSPESVVVLGSLAVKISDFHSLYRLVPPSGSGGFYPGRDPRYCAPEILSGMEPSTQSDIYSVGVILYELMTGRRPWSADQVMDIAMDRNYHHPVPPVELNPQIPPLLNSVILKALKPRPASRYDTASDILSELLLCRSSIMRTMNRDKFQAQSLAQKPAVPPPSPLLYQDSARLSPQSAREPGTTLRDIEESLELDDAMDNNQYQKRKFLAITAVALFIAVLAFIFGYGWKFIQNRDDMLGRGESQVVQVPNVVQLDETEAKFKLGHAKLGTQVEKVYSDDVPQGLVISQDPPAGKKVKQGRVVKLVVSLGHKDLVVPDLRKQPLREAQRLAEDMGFRVEVEREYSEDATEDTVVDQIPKPGEKSSAGKIIKLFVSKGPEPNEIEMPDLIGKNINDVYRILAEYGIPYGDIKSIQTNAMEPGYVVSQSILPGIRVDTSTMENVLVYIAESTDASGQGAGNDGLFPDDDPFSDGSPQDKLKKKALTVTVSQDGSEVVVVVIDKKGRTEAYRGEHNSGETVDLTLEGRGDVFVKVFINGKQEQQTQF